MTRFDPVRITIKEKNNQIVFVPDPAGVIQKGGTIFFSNRTALQLDVTLSGVALVTVAPKAQSDGYLVGNSGPQKLNCSNNATAQPYMLQVSDQFTLIQPSSGAGAVFLQLQLAAGNWMFWQNNDLQAHQPTPDAGTTWTTNPASITPFSFSQMVQFPTAGNYPYHCAAHPQEKGTIVVS